MHIQSGEQTSAKAHAGSAAKPFGYPCTLEMAHIHN